MFLWELDVKEFITELIEHKGDSSQSLKLQKSSHTRTCLYIVYQYYSTEAKKIVSNLTSHNFVQYKEELLLLDAKLSTILLYLLYEGDQHDFNKIYEDIQTNAIKNYVAILKTNAFSGLLFSKWLLVQPDQLKTLEYIAKEHLHN